MPFLPSKPQFTHDCDGCGFLGSDQTHDYYFCGPSTPYPTVIARFSSRGPDYMSGLEIALHVKATRPDHPLVKAMNLAIEQGHYVEPQEK